MGSKAILSRVGRKPRVFATATESELVAAAKGGESEALDVLLHRHSDALFWAAFRITKQREDAEDAVQDSLLRAFLHIREFDERSKFATWLTRIAINSALMILRKKRSVREVPEENLLDHKLDIDSPLAIESAPNPEQGYAQAQKEAMLRAGIQSLRPAIRTALEIRELQERSVKETAKMMGISVPATKARIFHAKRILRKSLRRRIAARPLTIQIARFVPASAANRRNKSKLEQRSAA